MRVGGKKYFGIDFVGVESRGGINQGKMWARCKA